MSKIPVFDVVGESYGYSFGHYLRLFAITWLPLLIATVAGYFVFRGFVPDYLALLKSRMMGVPADPMAEMAATGRIWLLDLAMMFLFMMMAVGITKEVLGVRAGPRFVYFRFGADELRLLAGFVIVFLILIVVIAAATAIAGAIAVMSMHGAVEQNPSSVEGVVGIVVLVLYLIAFYFLVRLSFFLPPVVVAEKRIGLGRSWELSRGNFWRIFAIGCLIWIPIFIVESIIVGVILVPAIVSAISQAGGDHNAYAYAFFAAYAARMPYIFVLTFFVSPIVYGLMLTPAALAYRALNPGEAALS